MVATGGLLKSLHLCVQLFLQAVDDGVHFYYTDSRLIRVPLRYQLFMKTIDPYVKIVCKGEKVLSDTDQQPRVECEGDFLHSPEETGYKASSR
ncbi:hypothetical protein DPMN_181243 [Dreissena polymorpha]|uniref:Uncharacterized protein n=1 Tax=Dreissena polymorpha TaxID=45954 RepID=A0A9D4DDF7_DREPO|nr:hypothetical protein DPMN_181243 [Dreissena polymorpha]